MDPLNTISATHALVGTVLAAYQTLDKITSLPNAFNEIKTRLPLVELMLNDATDALNDTTLSEEETKAILAVITPCNVAAVKMNCIFREVQSKCEKDQNARSWDIVSPLYHKALRGKGAHRAEKLMRTILQGLEEMARQRVFKTAMQKDVKALEEAIEGLSKVEPSLPDADFEAGGANVTQNNAAGAFGQLNAPRGGHNVFISGQYAAHTLNIGSKIPERKSAVLQRLSKDLRYRERKNINAKPVQGTCKWVVCHRTFEAWEQGKSLGLLWVSADPGCGKSVLARHIVDSVLPTDSTRTTCYFFFKDSFEDQRSATNALRCILHQLFVQKDTLFSEEILRRFEADNETLTDSFDDLWHILDAVAGNEEAGKIVIVLDAIDECDEEDRHKLSEELCSLYRGRKTHNLKFLLTGRPYRDIKTDFQPLPPSIRLSGDVDEREVIYQEINIFIRDRVQSIGKGKNLSQEDQDHLFEQLTKVQNPTYLWVDLTLKLISKENYVNRKVIDRATADLTGNVDAVYEKILRKSQEPEGTRRLLHLVVAAARPLTLEEIDVALALKEHSTSCADLDLMKQDIYDYVRDLSGLLIITIEDKLYLLHQTLKEFLVSTTLQMPSSKSKSKSKSNSNSDPAFVKWKHSFWLQESNSIIADICMSYLLFKEFETLSQSEEQSGSQVEESTWLAKCVDDYHFLDYAAKYWVTHFKKSSINIKSERERVLDICDGKRYFIWFRIYWTREKPPRSFTSLMLLSYFGFTGALAHLLPADISVLNHKDIHYQRSALSWASENGFVDTVELLIKGGDGWLRSLFKNGAEVDSMDIEDRTPLSYAAENGHVEVVKCLLFLGRANANVRDKFYETPRSYAFFFGHGRIVHLLTEKSSLTSSADSAWTRMLFSAIERGNLAIVKRLVEEDKNIINVKNDMGWSPLSWAAVNGHADILKLLLETGKASVNARDRCGRTLLSYVAENGQNDIVKLFLKFKADPNIPDHHHETPLFYAIRSGPQRFFVVKLLLEGKADVNIVNRMGHSLLLPAVECGDEDLVELLLPRMNPWLVHPRNSSYRLALSCATEMGNTAIASKLLEVANDNARKIIAIHGEDTSASVP